MAYLKHHWHLGCRFRTRRDSLPYAASLFAERSALNPDLFCSDCAKAARLALAKESAPKPDAVVCVGCSGSPDSPRRCIQGLCAVGSRCCSSPRNQFEGAIFGNALT